MDLHQTLEGGIPKDDFGFNDVKIRASFVRKVFTLVSIMLLIVAFMSSFPLFHDPTFKFITARENSYLYFLGLALFFITYLTLICCEGVRRAFPTNIICTGILTLSIGYMTMMITARYSIQSVALCLLITGICCICVIIFASQTKYDITGCFGLMLILSLVTIVFSFVALIATLVFHVYWLYTAYAGFSALVLMFYLLFDIQLIMGGRKYSISPEEYIFATIQLFLDIVMLFWMILRLFGGYREN